MEFNLQVTKSAMFRVTVLWCKLRWAVNVVNNFRRSNGVDDAPPVHRR